jgi:hypothetical protein
LKTVWRYLTFGKFVSLLELRALWMSRLGALSDRFEGTLPCKNRENMIADHLRWETTFEGRPELQEQLASMADRNVADGRNVLVVNCWFLGESESEQMWKKYVGSTEGIAIRSTLQRLEQSILAKQEFTTIGRVKYVDFSKHDMGVYHGSQAGERALLKEERYSFENEVRIVTANVVWPGCLNLDGSPPTSSQLAGPGMFDPNRPGLYLQVNLGTLIQAIVTAPGAENWFYDLVGNVCKRYQIDRPIEKSRLNHA